jgi:hypothetical protein
MHAAETYAAVQQFLWGFHARQARESRDGSEPKGWVFGNPGPEKKRGRSVNRTAQV